MATRCCAPVGWKPKLARYCAGSRVALGSTGARRLRRLAQALLRQLVGEQLFECQAVLSPVVAQGQLLDVGVGGRVVQVADGVIQRRQLVVAGQFVGQPVGQAARAEQAQALLAQLAQALLGKALGRRVDRGEGLVDRRWRFVTVQCAVLRVVDLQPGSTRASFAVAAQVGAALEPFLCALLKW